MQTVKARHPSSFLRTVLDATLPLLRSPKAKAHAVDPKTAAIAELSARDRADVGLGPEPARLIVQRDEDRL